MGIDKWAIYQVTVVVVIITWLIFYNWDWIIRNWWFRKSNLVFKQLIPELEHVLKIHNCLETSEIKGIDPERDFTRMGVLYHQLTVMDIGLPYRALANQTLRPEEAPRIWKNHLIRTLEYARNGKYKEYVELLKRENIAYSKVNEHQFRGK